MIKVKLQARELFRAAKRHGLELKYDQGYPNCALGMTAALIGEPMKKDDDIRKWISYKINDQDIYDKLSEKTGRTRKDLMALERGYEGGPKIVYRNNPYYEVGRSLREMVLKHRCGL